MRPPACSRASSASLYFERTTITEFSDEQENLEDENNEEQIVQKDSNDSAIKNTDHDENNLGDENIDINVDDTSENN